MYRLILQVWLQNNCDGTAYFPQDRHFNLNIASLPPYAVLRVDGPDEEDAEPRNKPRVKEKLKFEELAIIKDSLDEVTSLTKYTKIPLSLKCAIRRHSDYTSEAENMHLCFDLTYRLVTYHELGQTKLITCFSDAAGPFLSINGKM